MTSPELEDDQAVAAPGIATAWFLCASLLVLPSFLDYAQEAKAYLLTLTTLAAALAALMMAKFRVAVTGRLWLLPRHCIFALLGLVVVGVLSGLHGSASQTATLYGLRTLFFPILSALLLSAWISPGQLLQALAVSTTAVATLGLLQVLLHIQIWTPASDPGQFPAVTFGNRGLAAVYVGLGLVPALLLRGQAKGRHQHFYSLALCVQSLFILATMTRGCMIASLSSVALYACAAGRKRGKGDKPWTLPFRLLWFVLLVVGLAAWLITSNEPLSALLHQRLQPQNWLHNPRLELWRFSLQAWYDHGLVSWLLGLGPSSFATYAADWLRPSTIAPLRFQQAHNDLVQGLLEYGVAGVTLWLLLACSAVRKAWLGHARWFMPSMAYFGVVSCFFYAMQLPFLAFVFWLLVFVKMRMPVAAAPNLQDARKVWPALTFLSALVLVYAAEAGLRPLLEVNMQRQVRTVEPYATKQARDQYLQALLDYVPAPPLYAHLLSTYSGKTAR